MANDLMTFDTSRAKALGTKLVNKVTEVEATLNAIQKDVETDSADWWKGDTREGFVKNFEGTKKKINKELGDWLKEYDKLIKDIARKKEQFEKDMANMLNQ